MFKKIADICQKLVDENNEQERQKNPRKIINEFCIQFYLALELAKDKFDIRLEKPEVRERSEYLDLFVINKTNNKEKFAIEVKWSETKKGGYTNILKKIWADISRLEFYKREGIIKKGYFLMITNNHNCWYGVDKYSENAQILNCFRENNGTEIKIKNFQNIEGCNNIKKEGYRARWHPELENKKEDKFRYFLIEI